MLCCSQVGTWLLRRAVHRVRKLDRAALPTRAGASPRSELAQSLSVWVCRNFQATCVPALAALAVLWLGTLLVLAYDASQSTVLVTDYMLPAVHAAWSTALVLPAVQALLQADSTEQRTHWVGSSIVVLTIVSCAQAAAVWVLVVLAIAAVSAALLWRQRAGFVDIARQALQEVYAYGGPRMLVFLSCNVRACLWGAAAVELARSRTHSASLSWLHRLRSC